MHGRRGVDGARRFKRNTRDADDALQFEVPAVVAQVTVGDEHHLALEAADLHRLDHPLRAQLAGVEVFQPNGAALLDGLFKLQRQ